MGLGIINNRIFYMFSMTRIVLKVLVTVYCFRVKVCG